MVEVKELVVEEKDNLKRLDIFLTENTDESRNFLLKNIKSGKITVNDKVCYWKNTFCKKFIKYKWESINKVYSNQKIRRRRNTYRYILENMLKYKLWKRNILLLVY